MRSHAPSSIPVGHSCLVRVGPHGLLPHHSFLSDFVDRQPESSIAKATESPRPKRFPILHFISIWIALLVLCWILGLQITSIIHANSGLLAPPSTAEWCSPSFLGHSAVQTTECIVYQIRNDAQKGIGCVQLPAQLQKHWLYATEVTVPICLVLEFLDLVLLVCVNSKFRLFGGTKLKRPWFTMIGGICALVVVGVMSIFNATSLPAGITRSVLIANEGSGNGTRAICEAHLLPPALRGQTISYFDSIFNSLGCRWYSCQ